MQPTIPLAYDRSVRRVDEYGRLMVEVSPISKANICPYTGDEIPNHKQLGLDPKRIYNLLRDPDELAKAAPSFNLLPLLIIHKPHSARTHDGDLVVGSTGSDARFEAPYLKNSLVVWSGDAIDLIESDEQKELSAGYGYDADMTPGLYQGQPYDGVMRNIRGNHVTLVEEGRAGSDVVVGDSKLQLLEDEGMPTGKQAGALPPRASYVQGVIAAAVMPRLAKDAKLHMPKLREALLLAGATKQGWQAQRPRIIEQIRVATKGKLAQDADLDQVVELLNKLDDGTDAPDEDDTGLDAPPFDTPGTPPPPVPAAKAAPVVAAPPPEKPEAKDADEGAIVGKVLAFLQTRLSPEDLAAVRKLVMPEPAAAPAPAAPPPRAADEDPSDDGKTEPPMKPETITKAAMDAAIAKARRETEDATIARMTELAKAREFVKPWVGVLAQDCKAPEDFYKLALDTLRVELGDDVHPSAYRHILAAQPKAGDEPKRGARRLGMDAKSAASFADRFPQASALRVA